VQKFWRIKDLLEWTTRYFLDKGLTEPRLEAEVLLSYVLKKDRVYLYANYDKPVNGEEREQFRQIIKRRALGEPSAYITGRKEFMSLELVVSPAVLIPRPDTEVLVETALRLVREEPLKTVCDVGTGSGAIAVSMAYYAPQLMVYAIDISPQAMEVAEGNAARHKVEINLLQGDLLEPLLDRRVDMVLANLPYIPESELSRLDPGVKDYEPRLALTCPGDGLMLYRRLVPQAEIVLSPGGYLLMEIDPRQAEAAQELVLGFQEIEIIRDYGGRERVVKARKRAE